MVEYQGVSCGTLNGQGGCEHTIESKTGKLIYVHNKGILNTYAMYD